MQLSKYDFNLMEKFDICPGYVKIQMYKLYVKKEAIAIIDNIVQAIEFYNKYKDKIKDDD